MQLSYSDESLLCRETLPGTSLLACSTESHWKSLLVRSYRSDGDCEPYETHATPDQTIVVVLKGELDVEVFGGGKWRRGIYRPGSAGATASLQTDRMYWRLRNGSDHFEKVHLFLPRRLLEEAADHFSVTGQRRPAPSLSSLVFNDPMIAQLAAAVRAAMRAGAPDLYAQAAARWLAVHLQSSRPDRGGREDDRRQAPMSDARLARALEYISAHLDQPIDLDDIAAEAGISKFHFARLFRDQVGETPIRYILNQRLDLAARLLVTSDLPIAQIAFESGYANATHFSARFRQRFGKSPRAFRVR